MSKLMKIIYQYADGSTDSKNIGDSFDISDAIRTLGVQCSQRRADEYEKQEKGFLHAARGQRDLNGWDYFLPKLPLVGTREALRDREREALWDPMRGMELAAGPDNHANYPYITEVKFGSVQPGAPIFSYGSMEEAIEAADDLVKEKPGSGWASLAKERLSATLAKVTFDPAWLPQRVSVKDVFPSGCSKGGSHDKVNIGMLRAKYICKKCDCDLE